MPEDINFQEAMEAVGIKPLFLDENSDIATELSKPLRRKTNTEFVSDIMNFCPYGALAQVIVIQAVDQYCQQMAEAPVAELNHPLIDGAAYKACAEWILAQYKQHYGD